MSTEEQAPRPGWSVRKTAAAVGIAVVLAAGGGAAIWVATASGAGPGPGRGSPGGPGGRYFNLGALDSALHGEFVIADGTTELLQTGKTTEVSATSIAVTSTDGYSKTYTIDASTLLGRDIATGDQVTVIARKSDNLAISVVERTNQPHRHGLPRQPPRPTPN